MAKDFVCQGNIDRKMRGVVPMFVVGSELCLLRIERKYVREKS